MRKWEKFQSFVVLPPGTYLTSSEDRPYDLVTVTMLGGMYGSDGYPAEFDYYMELPPLPAGSQTGEAD